MSSLQHLVIISGRSGAGKTTAAHALEDMGFFVVDNLPPQLLDELLAITTDSKNKKEKVAVVIDVREAEFLKVLPEKWREISEKKYKKTLLFLDASDQKLIDRYQETKRKHPLDDGSGIKIALKNEKKILEPIYAIINKQIITDRFTSHELRNAIKKEILGSDFSDLNVTLLSFGYKHGVPEELDLCFDVRFLKNPYYDLKLRPLTGLDKEVRDYVFASKEAHEFLEKLVSLIEFLYPLYREEGKVSLTIALGCTGGHHRSVALIEALNDRLKNKLDSIRVRHRDI